MVKMVKNSGAAPLTFFAKCVSRLTGASAYGDPHRVKQLKTVAPAATQVSVPSGHFPQASTLAGFNGWLLSQIG